MAATSRLGEAGAGAKQYDAETMGEPRRDPEDRQVRGKRELEEKMLDKTVSYSFPASDPPSSLPDPEAEDSFAA